MTRYTRIGLTGANGTIGRVLLAGLGDEYEFKAFTRRPVDFPATIVNFDRARRSRKGPLRAWRPSFTWRPTPVQWPLGKACGITTSRVCTKCWKSAADPGSDAWSLPRPITPNTAILF